MAYATPANVITASINSNQVEYIDQVIDTDGVIANGAKAFAVNVTAGSGYVDITNEGISSGQITINTTTGPINFPAVDRQYGEIAFDFTGATFQIIVMR